MSEIQPVTIDLSPEDVLGLDEIAANLEADRHTVVKLAISAYLADYALEKKEAEESDREFDAGNFYTHEQAITLFEEQTKGRRAA